MSIFDTAYYNNELLNYYLTFDKAITAAGKDDEKAFQSTMKELIRLFSSYRELEQYRSDLIMIECILSEYGSLPRLSFFEEITRVDESNRDPFRPAVTFPHSAILLTQLLRTHDTDFERQLLRTHLSTTERWTYQLFETVYVLLITGKPELLPVFAENTEFSQIFKGISIRVLVCALARHDESFLHTAIGTGFTVDYSDLAVLCGNEELMHTYMEIFDCSGSTVDEFICGNIPIENRLVFYSQLPHYIEKSKYESLLETLSPISEFTAEELTDRYYGYLHHANNPLDTFSPPGISYVKLAENCTIYVNSTERIDIEKYLSDPNFIFYTPHIRYTLVISENAGFEPRNYLSYTVNSIKQLLKNDIIIPESPEICVLAKEALMKDNPSLTEKLIEKSLITEKNILSAIEYCTDNKLVKALNILNRSGLCANSPD